MHTPLNILEEKGQICECGPYFPGNSFLERGGGIFTVILANDNLHCMSGIPPFNVITCANFLLEVIAVTKAPVTYPTPGKERYLHYIKWQENILDLFPKLLLSKFVYMYRILHIAIQFPY